MADEKKKGIVTEFKEFILRGNVVELAVAVAVGAAFTAVVNSFVKDLITPLIGAIFGKTDFSTLTFTINKSKFLYGSFINNVITFFVVATVIFFLVVKPMNYLTERRRRGQGDEESDERACPECLSSIPKAATRCAFCTAQVPPVEAA
jgi:large conductance mechanosensitive channel